MSHVLCVRFVDGKTVLDTLVRLRVLDPGLLASHVGNPVTRWLLTPLAVDVVEGVEGVGIVVPSDSTVNDFEWGW